MRKLVIVRHGAYDEDLKLSTYGARQMRYLAEHLKAFDCARVIVLASTASRASASGDVMVEVLGCQIEYHELLWSDDVHRQNPLEVMNLIEQKAEQFDMVIVVTHLEYAGSLSQHIESMFHIRLPWFGMIKGSMLVFDIADKTCEHVDSEHR